MDIKNLLETVNTALDAARQPANTLVGFLIYATAVHRPGISKLKITSEIISDNASLGINTGQTPDRTENIVNQLVGKGYKVIYRPHPQYVRHHKEKLVKLAEDYAKFDDFEVQMDFTSNSVVMDADILMTDWSSIAFEYSFVTLKPVLFIDTPMKVMNPDYKELDVVPFDLEIRNRKAKAINCEA